MYLNDLKDFYFLFLFAIGKKKNCIELPVPLCCSKHYIPTMCTFFMQKSLFSKM